MSDPAGQPDTAERVELPELNPVIHGKLRLALLSLLAIPNRRPDSMTVVGTPPAVLVMTWNVDAVTPVFLIRMSPSVSSKMAGMTPPPT